MASSSDSNSDDNRYNKLGIKVAGGCGELHAIDSDSGDSETNDEESIGNSSPVSLKKGAPLSVPGAIQVFDAAVPNNFCVTASENVQIGNNTHFHGPVTIKQVFKNPGIDNASYTKTENETPASSPVIAKKLEESSHKLIYVPPWLKVTISVTSVGIIGIICALAFIIQSSNQDEKSHSDGESDSPIIKDSDFLKVVGVYYESLQFLVIMVIVVPITIVLMYSLLTSRVSDNKEVQNNGVSGNSLVDYFQGDFNASVEKSKPKEDPLFISPSHLRIVARTDWLAQPVENELSKIKQPVPWVIITHTATEGCYNQSQCVLRVRLIQMFHIESKNWDDIGYNFLVAGDGSAYFGRGWDYVGAHTLGYNRYSIGIAFIGTFNSETPPQKQIEACQKLIKLGVQLGKIKEDYKLFAHRQLASTLSPGDKLFDIIKEWPHFVKDDSNIADLLPKDD